MTTSKYQPFWRIVFKSKYTKKCFHHHSFRQPFNLQPDQHIFMDGDASSNLKISIMEILDSLTQNDIDIGDSNDLDDPANPPGSSTGGSSLNLHYTDTSDDEDPTQQGSGNTSGLDSHDDTSGGSSSGSTQQQGIMLTSNCQYITSIIK